MLFTLARIFGSCYSWIIIFFVEKFIVVFVLFREMGESAQEIAEAHKRYINDMREAERYTYNSLIIYTREPNGLTTPYLT